MTKKQQNPQFIVRSDPETFALVAELARRRRVKPTQWLRDAINLAIDLETGSQT